MANEYPIPKFHFQVEWGASKIGFTEVSGLDVEREVIEYRDDEIFQPQARSLNRER